MAIATVRPAAPTDVDEIVRIQAMTWAVAYAELIPAAALRKLDGADARAAWSAAIDVDDGRHHVFVAAEGAQTVGFCAAVAAEDGPAAERATSGNGHPTTRPELGASAWGDINTLLVEPRWGRRGHAGRLLAAATEALRGAGARYGLAWVPEPDQASRRFYTRAGWEPDGAARTLDTGAGTLREIRVTGSLDLRLSSSDAR
jgi:GNAT superfamily N-acetyltransferase